MQVLYQNGFVNQPSDDPRTRRTSSAAMAGSLDHVLANAAAANLVTGRDVWQINAEESVGFEYSRYNYNATLLYQPNQFRASDHNPELVGLDVPFSQQASTVTATATPDRVQKKKTASTIDVTVTGAQGVTPTGTRRVLGGRREGRARRRSAAATASATSGRSRTPGPGTSRCATWATTSRRPGTATTTVTVTSGKPVGRRRSATSRSWKAAWTSARWLNACGKLPTIRVVPGVVLLGEQADVVGAGRTAGRTGRARRRAGRPRRTPRPARTSRPGTGARRRRARRRRSRCGSAAAARRASGPARSPRWCRASAGRRRR